MTLAPKTGLLMLPWAILLAGCDTPAARSAPVDAEGKSAEAPPAASIEMAQASSPSDAAQNSAEALPADVVAFKVRRDGCDHFRGEEATDAARAEELAAKLQETCKGSDAQLAALRQRHSGDAAATAALATYEDSIE